MGDEAWNQDKVEGAVTEDLVRDVDAIVGLGVVSFGTSAHIDHFSRVRGRESTFSLPSRNSAFSNCNATTRAE
jgi:hypothetical protein